MRMKSFTRILIILIMCIFAISIPLGVLAASTGDAISAMEGMSGASVSDETEGKLGDILNSAIGLIQVAGTGIAMIMVTVLGIKYIMAAPSDKADVKKQITPLVIGAIILFASVNLVNIVATIADETLSSTV